MPTLDEEFLKRLEVLLTPHESVGQKLTTWLGIIIPISATAIALISFYVLTTDRIERLTSTDAQTEQEIKEHHESNRSMQYEIKTLQEKVARLEAKVKP